MATIILQGSREENGKAINLLKDKYSVFKKKAEFMGENGQTVVLEVFSESGNTEELTKEQIMKCLELCSNKERNCAECSYKKIKDCRQALIIDATAIVMRKEKTE